jgi:hypothetical protein
MRVFDRRKVLSVQRFAGQRIAPDRRIEGQIPDQFGPFVVRLDERLRRAQVLTEVVEER